MNNSSNNNMNIANINWSINNVLAGIPNLNEDIKAEMRSLQNMADFQRCISGYPSNYVPAAVNISPISTTPVGRLTDLKLSLQGSFPELKFNQSLADRIMGLYDSVRRALNDLDNSHDESANNHDALRRPVLRRDEGVEDITDTESENDEDFLSHRPVLVRQHAFREF